MKCRLCGFRANTIKSMGEHYRRKHPRSMKHKGHGKHTKSRNAKYCPECGKHL